MPEHPSATNLKITMHVVASLDGFIASKDNSISWLETEGSRYEPGVSISAEEAEAFVKAIGLGLSFPLRVIGSFRSGP